MGALLRRTVRVSFYVLGELRVVPTLRPVLAPDQVHAAMRTALAALTRR